MNDEELARLLAGAFDAQARSEVGDETPVPAPRFAEGAAPRTALRRRIRLAAPLAAAAAVVVAVASVAAYLSTGNGHGHGQQAAISAPARSHAASSAPSPASTSASPTKPPTKPVHIKLLNSDGSDYGVGMPVIAFFSRKITNGKPLQSATTVTVNGKAAKGAWYFEGSAANKGYPVEAHLRLENYWPAHSKIHVGIPAKGLSAGKSLSYDDDLSLDFRTGARHVATVDDSTHRMTVTSDGKKWGSFPVSLGASNTPTRRGVKVIMEKGRSICMSGPGYNECGVKYTQRLTYDGEYLHSAPWNISHINSGIDSSNGCTNLLPGDAKRLYNFLRPGDVVIYPNANGPAMQLGQGYGDWNVSWAQWRTGGLVPTR